MKDSPIYLDNAATTPLEPQVLEEMLPYLSQYFGNPSSIHSHGRITRSAIEKSRKKIADLLSVSPSEIFYTSSATESNNTILRKSLESLGIKNVVSSPIEHHAVLHTLDEIKKNQNCVVNYLNVNNIGDFDFDELESILKNNPNSLVSLMHINNEIGNINNIQKISTLCKEYQCFFHSDTVQSIGHQLINIKNTPVDFIIGSAHKFHGPKGVGFMYINSDCKIKPYITGGSQERNMRAGTENVAGIIGLAKALEIAIENRDAVEKHILTLKNKVINFVKTNLKEVSFNGKCDQTDQSAHHILSLNIPNTEKSEMLLMNFDIQNISISGGSACTSGAMQMSHVLEAIKADENSSSVRVSFSKFNTEAEIDYFNNTLAKLINS